MIKGGFQGLDISGVDLTAQSPSLPGAYAACAAADGKPIRVLTADGAVQCSVKKVSTNYVLAGITGDGKILSITIGSTDGISVSETVPSESGEATYTFGMPIDLSTNIGATNKYTVPSDGVVRLRVLTGTTVNAYSIEIYGKNNTGEIPDSSYYTFANIPAGTVGGDVAVSAFVKKGMQVFYTQHGSGEETAQIKCEFRPFEALE